jgi:hypothetical protein
MSWAKAELEHMGRIAIVEDPDIQYAYALSTVNGMMHLRQALEEMVGDPEYAEKRTDLKKTHDGVVRALKHLIKDYNVDINTIKSFNTRHVIKSYNFLNIKNNTRRNNNNKSNKTYKSNKMN